MGYPWHWLSIGMLLSFLGTSRLQDAGEFGSRIRPLSRSSYISRLQGTNIKRDTITNIKRDTITNLNNSSLTQPIPFPLRQHSKTVPTSPVIALEQSLYKNWPTEKEQNTADPYSSLTNRYKKDATFFFTHVEPHRFEYRAMFQHRAPTLEPFVHHFEPFGGAFPPLPKFPQLFQDVDSFPKLPHFGEFPFPTLRPAIRREWGPPTETQTPRPVLDENLDGPLKNYDVVLGHIQYPKIFRFNEERINIEEFERQKKVKFKNIELHQNHIVEPENVKRNQLLILHGGIFTVQEPPLYNRRKKNRKQNSYGYKIPFQL